MLFRSSVALNGDTALVGAYSDDTARGFDAGSAYVYVRSGGVWTQQTRLEAGDGSAQDLFGVSVALRGDTALVGAYQDDTAAGPNAGSAYVFVRSGGVWTQQARLWASDGTTNDYFGVSVALSGETALVGAHFDVGNAYVFVRSGAAWTEQARLGASDGSAGDGFGMSVALSGDTALVGAPYDDTATGVDAGSAHVFVRNGTNWSSSAQLKGDDVADSDEIQVAGRDPHDQVLLGDDPEDEVLAVLPLDLPHLDLLDDCGPVIGIDDRFADGESHMSGSPS